MKLEQMMAGALSSIDTEMLQRKQYQFLEGQKKVLGDLAAKIEAKRPMIGDAAKELKETYQPLSAYGFLEVEGFEGFNSLQFFYYLGKFLDKAVSPALAKLPRIQETARDIINSSGRGGLDLFSMVESVKSVEDLQHDVLEIKELGVLGFEKVVKHIYQRALDQFRYLQKRFLNRGADESRVYRDPWEDEKKKGGFNLAAIPYVKTELVSDNALLTDLLLDIAEQLPTEHTKKEKVKGKRKPKEVKFLDEFDVDQTARVLMEIADPTYLGYIKDPSSFLKRVSKSIRDYHDILSPLDISLVEFLEKQEDNPFAKISVNKDVVAKGMPDPSAMLSRLSGINYMGVRPNEEYVKPSGQLERRYFAARRNLMEHLAETLNAVGNAQSYDEKLGLARAAVEKGVKLKRRVRESLETSTTIKLKKDKRVDNEFYVGTSQGHGEFGFEREAAPNVRLKDVAGKTFDSMKQHLADLADYSKYLNLFGATAPRGKIKSNIIAIGPYGCGKTEIGRAIAGDPRFIGAEVSVTDALTCWFGEFEKNVDRVWDAARDLRRNSGDSKLVFLIMDEFDSWFNSSNGHWVDNTYQRVQKAIQQKLDGVVDYEGIIVVGLTNEPKKVPLAIYRRFKYVDIVGELELQERAGLLKKFLTNGLPLSSGFRSQHYQRWGEALEGATGDVIGKVADDIHYELMRKFIHEHAAEGRKLNGQIRRMQLRNNGELDKPYIKRAMGQYMSVTPDLVEQKIQAKLVEPIIREQIETSKRVYAEARHVLANLHKRQDAASGVIAADSQIVVPQYSVGQDIQ